MLGRNVPAGTSSEDTVDADPGASATFEEPGDKRGTMGRFEHGTAFAATGSSDVTEGTLAPPGVV
ncbi:MAG: hypothetical protein U0169_16975 [Polyangiaceae bacterium]